MSWSFVSLVDDQDMAPLDGLHQGWVFVDYNSISDSRLKGESLDGSVSKQIFILVNVKNMAGYLNKNKFIFLLVLNFANNKIAHLCQLIGMNHVIVNHLFDGTSSNKQFAH